MFDLYEIIELKNLVEADLKQKFEVWQIHKSYGNGAEIFAKNFNRTFILLSKLNKVNDSKVKEEYEDMYKKVNS